MKKIREYDQIYLTARPLQCFAFFALITSAQNRENNGFLAGVSLLHSSLHLLAHQNKALPLPFQMPVMQASQNVKTVVN